MDPLYWSSLMPTYLAEIKSHSLILSLWPKNFPGEPMGYLCIVELETKHVLGFDTASQGQQGAMTQNRPSNNSSGAPLQSPTNAWDKPLKSPVVAAPSTPSGAHGMGGSVSSVGDKTVGSNSVIGAGGPTG